MKYTMKTHKRVIKNGALLKSISDRNKLHILHEEIINLIKYLIIHDTTFKPCDFLKTLIVLFRKKKTLILSFSKKNK